MHRFVLHNEEIREASEKLLSPGQVGLLSGWGVFSTIKVVEGVLFAFERHWARMSRDAALLRVPMPPDPGAVHERLLRLLEANEAREATLRLVVVRNGGGMWQGPQSASASDVAALTTDLKDWGGGVRLSIVPQARHSANPFSGTKILSWAMNLAWLEEAQSHGFDEVILLNEGGEVAECTSANIFVARENRVFTPPLSSGCLPGVTREILLSDVQVARYPVVEKTLYPADLESADQVFITSTTRELLPVWVIGDRAVRYSGNARESLQAAFSEYVSSYVARAQSAPVSDSVSS
ncbi:MAG: aminotransferase class IV [Bryobacteraceae bacterium]